MCEGPNLPQDLLSSFLNMKESSRYLEKASSTEERGKGKIKNSVAKRGTEQGDSTPV